MTPPSPMEKILGESIKKILICFYKSHDHTEAHIHKHVVDFFCYFTLWFIALNIVIVLWSTPTPQLTMDQNIIT